MIRGTAYYNEHDPFAARWLRQLMRAGQIAPGHIDTRGIEDVCPADLTGFRQCHFFAGIGVWSYALRQAGWPDDRPVWTGSCPCQPFSSAGKRAGPADERHLWPAWQWLIGECRPDAIFGEQVASRDGLTWLDLVSTDLEGCGYAVGAADLPAAGFGAPHIRQRLYFVAYAQRLRSREGRTGEEGRRLALQPGRLGAAGILADRIGKGLEGRSQQSAGIPGQPREPRATNGFWADADWLPCVDGKQRPVEPGSFPLVTGTPSRLGRLRGYGNALCAPVAIEFVKAALTTARQGATVPTW